MLSNRVSHEAASRLGSGSPKDFNFEFFVFQAEEKHSDWWTWKRVWAWFKSIPDNSLWNCAICVLVLVNAVEAAAHTHARLRFMDAVKITCDVIYGIHIVAMIYQYKHLENIKRTAGKKWAFVIDLVSYLDNPIRSLYRKRKLQVGVYFVITVFLKFIRFHRPLSYLLSLTDNNLKNSVLETTLKYMYIILLGRWMSTLILFLKNDIETGDYGTPCHLPDKSEMIINGTIIDKAAVLATRRGKVALYFYFVDKMFIPIGSETASVHSYERFIMASIMLLGAFLVSGCAATSLSQVISLNMRPLETFMARFRLIMRNMNESRMPKILSNKVYTFYRMYWHKQKGVSVTQLLPIFPPTLPASIYTEIYFEAHQKSPILCDLSYQFLWEVSKVMSTIHYIPGDAIIKRGSAKSSIIYITYGDVEMVTAEDDDTPILRMTRGTIVNPCGGCMSMACSTSQVQIRAATFCTAHVLTAADLWRIAAKHGRVNGQSFIMNSAFEEHLEKVKRHYYGRIKHPVKYKSSILQFKRNLIALKEARNFEGKLLLARSDFFLLVANSYLMRNRADTSLTEESDEICLRPTFPCILQPQSSLLFAWDIFISILISFIAVAYPYNMIFKESVEVEFRFFDYVLSAGFVLDIFVHLSVGDNAEEGVPITFMHTCSQQMRNPWCTVDIVSVLPIFEFVGTGRYAGLNKLLRIPKVFRVLKAMEEECVYHSKILRFMSYCLMMFLSCYLMGSFQQAFNCAVDQSCFVNNFTHFPRWQKQRLETENRFVEDRLVYSMYFGISMVTTTSHKTDTLGGYDIRFALLGMVMLEMAMLINIFMAAMYSATITVTTAMESDYSACIDNVKAFLIRNHMDPKLRQRFINYLQLCWYTDMAYAITHQKRSITYDLPPHVHQDIVARQRNKYLLNLPFMQYMNKEALKEVSSHTRLFYTSPNEILLNTGDVNNEIYVIVQGFCEVYDPDTKVKINLMGENDYFGVLECLLRCPAYYTVRAVTHMQVMSLSKKWLSKFIVSPKMKSAIRATKKYPEYKSISIRREPFLEYENPTNPPNIQRFPILRKHIPDTAFQYPFTKLGKLSMLRYVFPRFTIRPDGKYMMRYEMFRGTCAFASAMIFPSYSYLKYQWPFLYYVTNILNYTAYFDIFQRMLVGFYNKDGILVYHPASTSANYVKGAFLMDLLACLPLEDLERDDVVAVRHGHHGQLSNFDKQLFMYSKAELKQFLMLNRLIQLYRVTNALESLKSYIQRDDVLLVLKAIPLIIVVINVVTCLMVVHSVEIYQSQGNPPWKIHDHRNILSNSTKHYANNSWVRLFKNQMGFNIIESPWNVHLIVYYWVVYETVTTGYGTFEPSNLSQVYILTAGMFATAMIITYFSVVVISIRSNVNQVLANFQENMKEIVTFMRRENLKPDLQKDVLEYYEHNWQKMGGLDYREVLKLCDQITLRTDAILHIYGHTFNKCPILYHCDISLLRVLGRAVYSYYFLEDTDIIERHDVISDLYIIDYGNIDHVDYRGAYRAVTKLSRGSIFGNLDNVQTFKCPTSFTACNNVHLLKINSAMFHAIISDFPTVKVLLNKNRPHNENFLASSDDTYQFGVHEISIGRLRISRQSVAFIKVTEKTWIRHLTTSSRFFQIYLIVVALVCVYGDVYNAGFQNNGENLITVLYFFDAMFFVKIILYIGLPYFLVDGSTKDTFTNMKKAYKKDEFRYDMMSCVPIETFSLFFPDNMWLAFSILRLNRMLRTVTIYKCLMRHQARVNANLKTSTIVSVFLWFSVFVHTTSCLYYAIGTLEEYRKEGSSWLTNPNRAQCDDDYLCSLYFVLTTFIHNGDTAFTPVQHSEVLFVIFFQIVASLIFMIYVGEFSNIIQYSSFRAYNFYSQYMELQDFLKNNRVSVNLVRLVERYSLHLWREARGRQVPVFLETAPQCLKLRVMAASYYYLLENHEYFKFCEPAFLRQLVGYMTLFTYCPDVFIVKESEITDAMYFVHKGEVQEQSDEIDEQRGQKYKSGQEFGTSQGLVRDTPFGYSYRATKSAQVLTLQLDNWEYLLEHFPKSRVAIYRNIPGHPYGELEYHRRKSRYDDPSAAQTREGSLENQEDEDAPKKALFALNSRRRSTVYGSYLPFTQAVQSDDQRLSTFDTQSQSSIEEEVEDAYGTISSQSVINKSAPSLMSQESYRDIEGDMKDEKNKPVEKKKDIKPPVTKEDSMKSDDKKDIQPSVTKEESKKSDDKKDIKPSVTKEESKKSDDKKDIKPSVTKEESKKSDDVMDIKPPESRDESITPDDASFFTREDDLWMEDEKPSSFDASKEKKGLLKDQEDKKKPGGILSFLPGDIKDKKEIETNYQKAEEESGPRVPRLSFLPGLVQKQGAESVPFAIKAPRRSILPGLSEQRPKTGIPHGPGHGTAQAPGHTPGHKPKEEAKTKQEFADSPRLPKFILDSEEKKRKDKEPYVPEEEEDKPIQDDSSPFPLMRPLHKKRATEDNIDKSEPGTSKKS